MKYRLTNPTEAFKIRGCAAITSERGTCPSACPLKGNGCFGDNRPARYTWEPGPSWVPLSALCHQLRALRPGTPTRFGMIGDLPGTGDRINKRDLERLDRACKHLRAWCYTHKPVLGDTATARRNRAAIAACKNLTINLSGNNPRHAAELLALDLAPVASIVPHAAARLTHWKMEPAGADLVICPHAHGGSGCITCTICADPNRDYVVGHPAHGTRWKTAELVTMNA